MDVSFMLLASVTPFMFLYLKKYLLVGVQSMLLIGMWFYVIEAMFFAAPSAFSITWLTFYGSLILAEVAWVQFIIRIVEDSKQYTTNYRSKEVFD
ncbi:hypothetical protein GCM10028778_17340 [Barrientosiimonas marina]|uniref:Uncharacterized protein n=1 Tax=Lentibacillus kimchii TaxID=1542911 RepID=A0ABW2UU62_9BACI